MCVVRCGTPNEQRNTKNKNQETNTNAKLKTPFEKRQTPNAQVLADVMTALCDNLRPAPFHYGTIALRLLGKLGGRNRRFLSEPMLLPPSTGTTWHTTDCFKVTRAL